MPNLGPTELIIVLIIVLLIFGAGKLASVGGALGRGVKDFRAAMKEGEEEPSEDQKKQDVSMAEATAESPKDEVQENSGSEEA